MALLLLLASLAAGGAAAIVLRGMGTGWRVGRLISVAPPRSLADVAAAVERGERTYVRVEGRVGSDEEFPDENDLPLVFRRRRLEHRGARGWETLDDQREAVPFWLQERGERVGIDAEALGDGLVVVPRVSVGRAADLPADADGGLALRPETAVRLRVEQVSATDHATAAGVPTRGSTGEVMLTAGLGRPLVLTTLEPAAAMRVLASEQRPGVLLASGLLAVSGILLVAAAASALLGR